jgi:hypothetical protein
MPRKKTCPASCRLRAARVGSTVSQGMNCARRAGMLRLNVKGHALSWSCSRFGGPRSVVAVFAHWRATLRRGRVRALEGHAPSWPCSRFGGPRSVVVVRQALAYAPATRKLTEGVPPFGCGGRSRARNGNLALSDQIREPTRCPRVRNRGRNSKGTSAFRHRYW